ncbi:glycosyltransferase family 4 protein [Pantoea allii]|uniref:Glycosyltransferase family 4 protein n=1 Tax=Pantoea allii TaxID=574096 RepID=A0ABS6VI38_9GAMM|nr:MULTISPECIES: glycosyltransferase family 4 protein [Pantoea]MBW1215431.1 glycosyltransferase family 4 protein [Pantoea allii]MBW1258958.1 glycosyltransferase family 4 protein [Pantoea allii]MBW1268147.1 glycosyltransferase family 4 protein [Pantoea allii]MBW1290154.1 glycosyltransferase family 4 protein [Pantoea allii]OAE06587.1 lipopolysaccharide biosynthesis protein [Pantoea sp. OXWO6B1]
MKKLHIINLGKMGGVERLFLQYINDFSDGHDDVICISNEIDDDIRRHIPQQKITFANRWINGLKLKVPQFLRKYVLQKRIEASDADVIVVWDLIPGLAAKPRRAALVYYDHGCSWRYPKNKKTLNFMAMLDGVISASYASNRVMQHRFNLPCPHHVVINRIMVPQGINPATRTLKNPIRLGTASRQVSLKGISVALLTLKELRQRGHNVVLEIAGKGPDHDAFVGLAERLNISEFVTFSGFQHDISTFFNRIDLYLSTPVTEPFGLSCMEALYFGVPVIFPMIDGQPEVVSHQQCGIGLMPSVTIDEHEKLTGIRVDFPYQIYDPVHDVMEEAKLVSHIDCANAVEILSGHETYQRFSETAKAWTAEHFDYALFKTEFNDALMDVISKK